MGEELYISYDKVPVDPVRKFIGQNSAPFSLLSCLFLYQTNESTIRNQLKYTKSNLLMKTE